MSGSRSNNVYMYVHSSAIHHNFQHNGFWKKIHINPYTRVMVYKYYATPNIILHWRAHAWVFMCVCACMCGFFLRGCVCVYVCVWFYKCCLAGYRERYNTILWFYSVKPGIKRTKEIYLVFVYTYTEEWERTKVYLTNQCVCITVIVVFVRVCVCVCACVYTCMDYFSTAWECVGILCNI